MKCKAKTATGKPCKMNAIKGGRFCFTHAPETRQAQAAARRLGGKNSSTPHAGNAADIPADIASIAEAGKILKYTLAELIVMENSIPRARALLALFDSYIKSFEIGELEMRIQALEARQK